MHRIVMASIFILMAASLLVGCAGVQQSLQPRDIQELRAAVASVRAAGADKECPEEYEKVTALLDDVEKTYYSCRTQEAVKKARAALGQAKALCPDTDGDGVTDEKDTCPGTPKGVKVDKQGCPLDSDGDGVPDYLDKCPGTPKGVKVDGMGCPVDTDGDGVPDYLDKCPGTPKDVKVDGVGCPVDTDKDGVPDYLDECPGTPQGVAVNSNGCPLDSDKDGVYDYLDKCPDTPKGAKVNASGCWVIDPILFDTAKWEIKRAGYRVLGQVLSVLGKNPGLRLKIEGNTDSRASAAYNQMLSLKRAQAVIDYMVGRGIKADRFEVVGYGFSRPAATNDTSEGMSLNRRVNTLIIR